MDEITVEVGSATNAHVLPASSAASAAAASIVATESSIDKSDSNSRGRSLSRQSSGSLPILQQRKLEDLERRRSHSPSRSSSSEFELEVVSTASSSTSQGPTPAHGRPPLFRQKGLLSSPGGTPLGSSLPDAPDEAAEIARAVAESRQRAAARVRSFMHHSIVCMDNHRTY